MSYMSVGNDEKGFQTTPVANVNVAGVDYLVVTTAFVPVKSYMGGKRKSETNNIGWLPSPYFQTGAQTAMKRSNLPRHIRRGVSAFGILTRPVTWYIKEREVDG
ncbi:hypothetical protein K439DRAFT_1526107 [Ramaria rubella]|nr:hypothetical protein K439DRAFT_1526107 [Ramaria rubella]